MTDPTVEPPTTERVTSGLSADAIDALYRAQWSPVLNYMRLRIGPADALDAAADVFARAWSRATTYSANAGSADTWLWAIARNRATDTLRRTDRAPFALTHDVADDGKGADLSAGVQHAEETARLLAAVHALPAADRDLIALRFGAGHSNREIAALIGSSTGSIAVRLHRALRKVRNTLEQGE